MCFEDALITYNENKSRVFVRQNGDRYLLKPPAKSDCTKPNSYLFGSLARHELDNSYTGIIFTNIDENAFNILLYEDALQFFNTNKDCDLILGWPQDYGNAQYGLPIMSLSKYKDMPSLTVLNKLTACLNAEPDHTVYMGLEAASKELLDIVDNNKMDIYSAAGASPGTKLFNGVTDLIRYTMSQARLYTYGNNIERIIAVYLNEILAESGYCVRWARDVWEPLGTDPKLNSIYGDIFIMQSDFYKRLDSIPDYEILGALESNPDKHLCVDIKIGSIYDKFGSISSTSLNNFPAENHWYMCIAGGLTKIGLLKSTRNVLKTKPFDAPAFNLQDAISAMEFEFPL